VAMSKWVRRLRFMKTAGQLVTTFGSSANPFLYRKQNPRTITRCLSADAPGMNVGISSAKQFL